MNLPDASPRLRPLAAGALVADVGGSNARFGWFDGTTGDIGHVVTLSVAQHPGIVPAALHYLDNLRLARGAGFQPPVAASIAVATAVTGDRVELTNSHWSFSREEAATALGLETLAVINDFEALALALPRLRADQLRYVGTGQQDTLAPRSGALAVVGPGTGLGVATVVQTRLGWVALAGEGGHATLAPGDDYEASLLNLIRRRHAHVSAERLLSGIGLPTLYGAVCELAGAGNEPVREAPTIVDAGLAGEPLARRTLDVFCALLGSFTGNVALTVGARGGVFIGGGIVPRLGAFFDDSAFRPRFQNKGRLSSYLAAIPTAVITDTLAALTGAAAALDMATQTR